MSRRGIDRFRAASLRGLLRFALRRANLPHRGIDAKPAVAFLFKSLGLAKGLDATEPFVAVVLHSAGVVRLFILDPTGAAVDVGFDLLVKPAALRRGAWRRVQLRRVDAFRNES